MTEEEKLLQAALAQALASNEAGREASAMLNGAEAKKALEELRQDAPADATGPFLRKIEHLREEKAAPASERAEDEVIEGAAAPAPSLPDQPAPRAKVMLLPRAGVNPHVTAPSLLKRAELGLLVAAPDGLRTVGGGTVRVATLEQPNEDSTGSGSTPKERPRRLWLWAALIAALAGVIPWSVVTLVRSERGTDPEGGRQQGPGSAITGQTAPGLANPLPATTAILTATAEPPAAVPSIAAPASSSVPPKSSKAGASARPTADVSIPRTAAPAPSSTGTGPWM